MPSSRSNTPLLAHVRIMSQGLIDIASSITTALGRKRTRDLRTVRSGQSWMADTQAMAPIWSADTPRTTGPWTCWIDRFGWSSDRRRWREITDLGPENVLRALTQEFEIFISHQPSFAPPNPAEWTQLIIDASAESIRLLCACCGHPEIADSWRKHLREFLIQRSQRLADESLLARYGEKGSRRDPDRKQLRSRRGERQQKRGMSRGKSAPKTPASVEKREGSLDSDTRRTILMEKLRTLPMVSRKDAGVILNLKKTAVQERIKDGRLKMPSRGYVTSDSVKRLLQGSAKKSKGEHANFLDRERPFPTMKDR